MAADGNGDAEFGSCCEELRSVLIGEGFEPLISVAPNGVLYLAVGIVDTEDEEESGLFDHPLFYCPFCGKELQTEAEVEAKSADEGDA